MFSEYGYLLERNQISLTGATYLNFRQSLTYDCRYLNGESIAIENDEADDMIFPEDRTLNRRRLYLQNLIMYPNMHLTIRCQEWCSIGNLVMDSGARLTIRSPIIIIEQDRDSIHPESELDLHEFEFLGMMRFSRKHININEFLQEGRQIQFDFIPDPHTRYKDAYSDHVFLINGRAYEWNPGTYVTNHRGEIVNEMTEYDQWDNLDKFWVWDPEDMIHLPKQRERDENGNLLNFPEEKIDEKPSGVYTRRFYDTVLNHRKEPASKAKSARSVINSQWFN